MKKSILQIGLPLTKVQLQKISGGFAPCNTRDDCADIYNRTAFDPLPETSFNCWGGWCSFA